MKIIASIVYLLIFTSTILISQTASDALRYSYLNVQGTARGTGIGGATGALGGDFTALSINPAGIGGYWKSEFMITPTYVHTRTRSTLTGGNQQEEQVNKFQFSNLGIVFANQTKRGSWKSAGLGLGMNKMNTYNQDFAFRGETMGSITDRFAGLAFNLFPAELDPFEAGPAYETGAIYDFDEDLIYETDFDQSRQIPFNKGQLVKTQGYYNEMVINFGGNYQDKLLLGGTLGIPFVSYESEKRYSEQDQTDVIPAFDQLAFDEFLTTQGVGVNGKIGAIIKIDHQLRFGLAVHSPGFLTLTDRYNTDLQYAYTDENGSESFISHSPDGEFEYGLRTPWKAVGSAAYIFGKSGFISADIEYTDYSSAKFNFTRNSDALADREYEDEVNQIISESYSGAINVRVGGELAMQAFRLRGGIQLLQSPFIDDGSLQTVFSFGTGIRGNKAFLDLAYQLSNVEEGYLPYEIVDAPNQFVTNKIYRGQLLLTVGFKI